MEAGVGFGDGRPGSGARMTGERPSGARSVLIVGEASRHQDTGPWPAQHHRFARNDRRAVVTLDSPLDYPA
jgi:hypothetical protein